MRMSLSISSDQGRRTGKAKGGIPSPQLELHLVSQVRTAEMYTVSQVIALTNKTRHTFVNLFLKIVDSN